IWKARHDRWWRHAVEVVERYVDGGVTDREWETAEQELLRAIDEIRDEHPYPEYTIRPKHAARWAVHWLLARGNSANMMTTVASTVAELAGLLALLKSRNYSMALDVRRTAEAQERERQCRLLRDIVGNPFRPVGVDRLWLSWRD